MSLLNGGNHGINYANPSLVGGTGSGTAKIFPSLLGTGFDNGGGVLPQPAGVVAAQNQLIAPMAEQQLFDVKAAGYVYVHGASPTVNFVFQQGSSLTPGSNTTMATMSSAASLTTASYYPWAFKAQIQGDSKSGIIQIMNATFYVNGSSETLTLTDLTGVNLTTTNYPFVIGITFGVSDSLNVGAMSQWGFYDAN